METELVFEILFFRMLYCNQIIDGVWLECHGGGDKDDRVDNNNGDDSNCKNSADNDDDMLLLLNITPVKVNYYVQFQS
jgi:hypothetical protein